MKKIKKDAKDIVGLSIGLGVGASMMGAVGSPVSLTPMVRFMPAITALTMGKHLIRKIKKKKRRK